MRPLTRAASLSAALAALSLPVAALAHGPAPAVLGLPEGASLDDGVVRLSTGLAVRAASQRWSFLCSAAWGGPGAPLAVTGAEGRVWVVGEGRVTSLDGEREEARAADVRDVAHAFGEAWLLESDALRSLDSGRRVDLQERFESVAGFGEWVALVRRDDAGVIVEWRDEEGALAQRETHEDLAEAVSVTLRSDGQGLVLALVLPDAYQLRWLAPPETLPADAPRDARAEGALLSVVGGDILAPTRLDGPVRIGDATWVAAEGSLWSLESDGFSPGDASLPTGVTCLQPARDGLAVCTQTALTHVTSSDPRPSAHLELTDLRGPRASDIAPDAWSSCQAEWLDFARHAGLPAGHDASASEAEETTGCATAPRSRSHPVAALALFLAALVRSGVRTRARASAR